LVTATTASIAGNATPSFISVGGLSRRVGANVIARGLRKVGVGNFIADIEAQIVDGAVPFASNVAQRVPGGVF
jgi:hypothetical protein